MAASRGLEPLTDRLESGCSIPLSYEAVKNGRDTETRTRTLIRRGILNPLCLPFHHIPFLKDNITMGSVFKEKNDV